MRWRQQCIGPATATAAAAFLALSISTEQSLRNLQHRWGCRPIYMYDFARCHCDTVHCVCRTLHHCPVSCGVGACGRISFPGQEEWRAGGLQAYFGGVLGLSQFVYINKHFFLL